ncbi:hypothetical protein QH494_19795 [Sphingomonas sp. AR_OL41]|uniref:Bbp16 family capsid cement protein n=1 Tax=Sphingomonas sp. AR_OL41 TaxID=3042729 RepID=UPI00247FF909|nr:hypothetical protein [Sphingomonas sp. AR_OL41]MDH7974438.1 hypothetical protein [Sphingomonas sp. AR_OL41]
MIFDSTTLFSNAQAVTATAASTNIIDLGATGTVFGAASAITRDIGKGAEVPIGIRVVEAFNNLTSLTVTVETDDNAGFSSPTTVWTSIGFPVADLVPGARLLLPDEVPVGVSERYVRLKYTVAGTAPTTGKITAGIVAAVQTNG